METLLASSGYDRKKVKEKHLYRFMTIEEAKRLRPGDHVAILDRHGEVREVKINGKPKIWKTRPDEVDIPFKYGMYEHGTERFRRGKPTSFIVRVDENLDENPRRSQFKPPFDVGVWSERGEIIINVVDANEKDVSYWDTEDVNQLIEDGYFDTSGFIIGREVRPGRLEQSVLDYLYEMKVIPSAELAD